MTVAVPRSREGACSRSTCIRSWQRGEWIDDRPDFPTERRERNRIIRPLHGAHNKLNPSNDHHLGPSPAQCPVYTQYMCCITIHAITSVRPRLSLQQTTTTRDHTTSHLHIMCVQASNSIRIQSLSLFKDLSSLLPFFNSTRQSPPMPSSPTAAPPSYDRDYVRYS